MDPNVQSALVRTEHYADYQELCNTIHDHTFPWGYNKPSHVLIGINEGRAYITTAITLDNIERYSWLKHMATKHELELKEPVSLEHFLIRYVTYKLTEDLDIFK